MTTKPTFFRKPFFFLFSVIASLSIISCHKDVSIDPQPAVALKVYTAAYNWGDLSINKAMETDSVQYDALDKIKRVVTYNNIGLLRDVEFTYTGSKITLNTSYQDEYDLDEQGRVIYHSCTDNQNGVNIVDIDRYAYDSNGYLSQVIMSFTYNGIPDVYSNINYTVVNGNYTQYSLIDIDNNKISRQYNFTYNLSKAVKSPCSFFSPIFANEAYSNIDKYLNYGKSSVNLLTGLSYTISNEDNSVSKGSLQAVTNINSDGYITALNFEGNAIAGFPTDNLSPLPRAVNFNLKQ